MTPFQTTAREKVLTAIDRYGNAWAGTGVQANAWTAAVEAVDELIAALSPPPPSWQPIETAPRDGTQILFGLEGTDQINRGFWWTEDESSIGHWFMVGGKWAPTHWMPLPPPPEPPVTTLSLPPSEPIPPP